MSNSRYLFNVATIQLVFSNEPSDVLLDYIVDQLSGGFTLYAKIYCPRDHKHF